MLNTAARRPARLLSIAGALALLGAVVTASSSGATATWSAMGDGLNDPSYGEVYAVVPGAGGVVYAGGLFTQSGSTSVAKVAKWDGSTWSALGSGLGTDPAALEVDGSGNLYAAGGFLTAGGQSVKRIAKWDGSSWSALGPGLNNFAVTLLADGKDLYAGGFFTKTGDNVTSLGYIAKWNGSSWSQVGSGLTGGVVALAKCGGSLYAAGSFTVTLDSVTTKNIARWDGSAWRPLGTGTVGTVRSLACDGSGGLYVGGDFLKVNTAVDSRFVAKWDGSAWSSTGATSGTALGGPPTAMVWMDGTLIVGGSDVTSAAGVSVAGLAQWNGSTWAPFGSGVAHTTDNWYIYGMAASATSLYVGGHFTSANGVPATNIARYSTAPPPAVTPTFDTPVPTVGGYTVNVTDYDASYSWNVSSDVGTANAGTASGPTLPVTVTGLEPGQSATLTVTVSRTGYSDASATVSGTAKSGLLPVLAAPVSKRGGFSVQVANFDPGYTWSATCSAGRVLRERLRSGALVYSVRGLRPGQTATITVTAVSSDEPARAADATGRARPRR